MNLCVELEISFRSKNLKNKRLVKLILILLPFRKIAGFCDLYAKGGKLIIENCGTGFGGRLRGGGGEGIITSSLSRSELSFKDIADKPLTFSWLDLRWFIEYR